MADDRSSSTAPNDDAIEVIAAAWLAAEEGLASGSTGNPTQAEIDARSFSERYDAAIHRATREDLRLAWEAARKVQADQEMGSEAWAAARRVSELLRGEYQAADPDATDDAGDAATRG